MKNISDEIRQHNRESFRREACGLPEQSQQEREQQEEQAALVFNELFRQIRAAFPASMSAFRTQADLDEFRRQWMLSFAENGITTLAQVSAGMRMARRQERPFLPSPGQFVAWCKEACGSLGVTAQDVIAEYKKWRNESYRYENSEKYPWRAPVMYHICVELKRLGYERQLNHAELEQEAGRQLAKWEKRVADGKPVPPIRRAIAGPSQSQNSGPTPAQLLLAEFQRRKAAGRLI